MAQDRIRSHLPFPKKGVRILKVPADWSLGQDTVEGVVIDTIFGEAASQCSSD